MRMGFEHMPADKPTEAEIESAWLKARPMTRRDPALYRIAPDILQSVIRRDRYDVQGKYGWRIEHGRPVPYHRLSLEAALRRIERGLREDQRSYRDAGAGR